MRALTFLIMLVNYSCTKYSLLSRDAVGIHINGMEMKISRIDEFDWRVGKRKEGKVSQSFMFTFETPKLKTKDLEFLSEQKGINSWIFRLIVERGSFRQDLGSIYVPFITPRHGRGQSMGQASNVSIKVFYAAAYASERFRNFSCPAFEHNRKINDIQIVGEDHVINITLGPISTYQEKSQKLELTPNAFNGGNSLEGNYFIEFAPYDYDKKLIHSSFKRLPHFIHVGIEKRVDIYSCRGERPELIPAP